MRIDRLIVKNFKGFAHREFDFHPRLNLIVGENGSGKTSLLEALSVAAGSWFLGLRGYDTRHLRSDDDVRLEGFETSNGMHWEKQFPCRVEATGWVAEKTMSWTRTLNTEKGRTTYIEARNIKEAASESDQAVRQGKPVTLPLISYYSTGRLWNVPREKAKVRTANEIKGKSSLSRLEAYRNSVDPRISVPELVEWIARESWRTFQQGGAVSSTFAAGSRALLRNVQGAKEVYFDAEFGEVVVRFESGDRQPFNNLSDGQRCMMGLAGDLARKAAILNPHLGDRVLDETPGIVLIDELDLHLHPKWQRRVIEDLRGTFPALQFICTTHSPFLIQSLRSGEELLMLGGQPTANLSDLPLDKIARGIQGVDTPEVSARYDEMRQVAKSYLEVLDRAEGAPAETLEEYRQDLAQKIAPYADNPAFQAFLEMKRVARLGS